ncbi:MAG: hypothetical protein ACK56I_01025, partial [bacterium]
MGHVLDRCSELPPAGLHEIVLVLVLLQVLLLVFILRLVLVPATDGLEAVCVHALVTLLVQAKQ